MRYKMVAVFILLNISIFANASSISGMVEIIQSGPEYKGVVFVKVKGSIQSKPDCSNNSTWDFAFNGNDESGKTMLSLLLSAFATGKTVGFYGKSDCNFWGTVEDLGYVNIR